MKPLLFAALLVLLNFMPGKQVPAQPAPQIMSSLLTAVEIPPQAEHQYSIIWLHGLGADGHDFEGIVPALHLTQEQHIHFIFPNAPVQPVTINAGMKMRAWYDILAMHRQLKADIDGIYQSAAAIAQIIRNESALGIPPNNIILAGFSQGGTIALHAGLRYPLKLAGIIALSTYLPTIEQLPKEHSLANQTTPILMAHGTYDPVVDIQYGRKTYHDLKSAQYPVQWYEYEMQHTVSPEEIARISEFINAVFNEISP